MDILEVIEKVNTVFIEVLEDDDIQINYETTSTDIEEWDSLNHIMLVVGIEKHFNIKFQSNEIHGFKNVGEMCEAIKGKLDV